MPKANVVIIVDTVALEAQSVIVDVNMLLHTVFRVVTVIFGSMGQETFYIIRLRVLYMYRCSRHEPGKSPERPQVNAIVDRKLGCHMEYFIIVFQKKQGKDMSKDKQAVQKLRLSVL